jgi:hypothetical protein
MPLLVSSLSTSKTIRRGILTTGLCLGMGCLAVFVSGKPSPAAPPKSAVVKETADSEGYAYIDEMLKDKSTKRSGFAPYRTSVATMEGDVFKHSLMTEVGGVKASDTLSVLTLKIDGKYERFQATVGRSDDEARSGPAYAYFEVWGDNTCFFRSTPIRSAASMVTTPSGATIRKTPQTINIVVRGTRTLQLVTRYASTLDQQAPDVMRAHGCVWGDPRLLTATASAAPPSVATNTPPPVTTVEKPEVTQPRVAATPPSAQPVKNPVKTPVQTSPIVKNTPDPLLDPRRNSVRMAVLLLASGVGSTAGDNPASLPALHYPMKIALLPLRPSLPASNERRRGSASKAAMQPTDPQLQKLLEISLPTARRGKASLFTLADSSTTADLTRLLPASLLSAIIEPTAPDITPLSSLCRIKQIDAILIPSLLPGSGTATRGGSRLDLRLFDAATGTLLARSVQIISSSSKN